MKQTYSFTNKKPRYLKSVPYLFILALILNTQTLSFAVEHSHQHDEHSHSHESESHDDHEEPELKFSTAELDEFSIKLSQVSTGEISKTIDLSGEINIAPERLFHIVPRVSGVVREVFKQLGDKVTKGELLVTLSSRELADAKAQLVVTDSLWQQANTNLKREKNLYSSKVSSKRAYLAAKQVQAEMSVKRKAAKQQLLAIGLSNNAITSVLNQADNNLSLYELRASADGVIIERKVALGDVLEANERGFTVADLSQVWVNLTVYQKDLGLIKQGQQVIISTSFGLDDKKTITGTISWLSPLLDETTRSATARVIIENKTGHWRPGLFANAKVSVEKRGARVVIPLSALQTIEGQTIVFVQHKIGMFEPQVVQLGHRDQQQVEILQGLKPGQTYVSQNAFVLKAQSQKSSFGHGHNH